MTIIIPTNQGGCNSANDYNNDDKDDTTLTIES